MFRLVGLLQRRPELTHAQFKAHWIERHTEIARRIPGLRRYLVAPIASMVDGTPSPWDGIGELWFDSREAWEQAFASPEWDGARDDLPNFKAGGPMFLCEEEIDVPIAERAGSAS